MVFPCVQCGLCCCHVDIVPELQNYNRGDGVCCHLKDNMCEIYEQRPEICNVQAMYKSKYRAIMDEKTFIKENLNACMKLAEGNPEILLKLESFYRQEV